MSESVENVCEICLQEIGNNKASTSSSNLQSTKRKSVICNQCSFNFNRQTLLIKDDLQEDLKPLKFVEFNTDNLNIVEVPCQSKFFDCGYSTVSNVNTEFVAVKCEEFFIEDEVQEDIKPLKLVEFQTDIPKIIEVSVRTGEKPHKCKVCDCSCIHLTALNHENMSMHTDEMHYECKLCHFPSVHLAKLKQQNMRVHTVKRSYTCEVCDYSCPNLSKFLIHTRKHTGYKPYKCEFCDYSSAQMRLLKSHMRRHTGEKPYNCNVCDHSFAHLSSLKYHNMRMHTGGMPYKCDICDYSCVKLLNFTKHLRKHWY